MRRPRQTNASAWIALLIVSVVAFPLTVRAGGTDKAADGQRSFWGFIENRGQLDAAVLYYALGSRSAVYFTADGPVLELHETTGQGLERAAQGDYPMRERERRPPVSTRRFAMGIRFVRADPSATVEGVGSLPGRRNYLLGDDPRQWRSDVPAFAQVAYRDVWPGIDLIYRSEAGGLSYEIVAGPGADLSRVAFGYEGAEPDCAADGACRLDTPLGSVEDERPGGVDRTGVLRITERPRSSEGAIGIERTAPRGPGTRFAMELRWGSFLGGSRDDAVHAVTLDADQRPVVTGATSSTDFPTTLGVLEPAYNGLADAFVTKWEADGTTLIWSTYLGASADDRGWAIRLDGSGRPVVAGVTNSDDYPVTSGVYDTTLNGEYDAFVTKLEADGSALVWSTFFGGTSREWNVSGVALDAAGRPVFVGSTRSSDLPTSGDAHDDSFNGTRDAFVAALTADGTALAFSTFLGGAEDDIAEDVALDTAGRPVVVGRTSSSDFPTTAGALQDTIGGSGDGFVTKLTGDAGDLVFSTYLGGSDDDKAFAVALDDSDQVLVTGSTESPDFPTTAGSFSTTYAGQGDVFVSRLEPDGTALVWGTYFGGSGGERGLDVTLDATASPVFVGWTCSPDYPLAGPPFSDTSASCDGVLTKLSADGSGTPYSTYVGGWFDDSAFGLALTELDRIVVGGETFSTNFPTTPGSFDTTHNSADAGYDAYVIQMLRPVYCSHVSGEPDPVLLLEKARDHSCPERTSAGNAIDLVEGDLVDIGPDDVGNVELLACGSSKGVIGNDVTPGPEQALFQIARETPDGSYTDGAQPGLVGDRSVLAGDCP